MTWDRNGNVTLIEDNIHGGLDVAYTNDNVNRLTKAEEGTWNGSSITSRTREQNWTLDQVGNWEVAKLDLDGDNNWNETGEYNDDRTHNVVNELTARDTDDNGTDNYTLTYDNVGNLTDDGEAYEYVYDVWGRLRKVLNTSTQALIEEFWYNGLGFRITFHADATGNGTTDASDPKYHLIYDERWRHVATYRADDDNPKEAFVSHQAGLDGGGSSSYIDSVILRQRDANSGWVNAADGTMEERRNFCQNWRNDTSALLTSAGVMVEWAKFTAYGIPIGLPAGDIDSDFITDTGDVDAIKNWVAAYDVRADLDLDGDIDATDGTLAEGYEGWQLGWNELSHADVANRIGYAGYHKDINLDISHVRNRVLERHLGRWTRRDPLGYVDGMSLYEYVRSQPQASLDATGTTRYIIIFEGNSYYPGELLYSESKAKYRATYRWPEWIDAATVEGDNEYHKYVHWDDAKAWNDLKRNVLDHYTPYQRYDDCLSYPAIYVLGWSMGGDAAINLINRLVREDVCIFAGGVIADPIPRGLGTIASAIFGANYRVNTAPGLVKNFYQRVALLKGWPVDGADNTQLFRSDFVNPSNAHYEIALRNEAEGRQLGPTPCKYAVEGIGMGSYYLPPPGVHCDLCSGFSSDPSRPCWKCPGAR